MLIIILKYIKTNIQLKTMQGFDPIRRKNKIINGEEGMEKCKDNVT
jgi:hypothetical protein